VPQFFAQVDRDKVLKQGIALSSVYQALQAFLGGGAFVNYFQPVWPGLGRCISRPRASSRTRAENVGQFYVRNATGQAVPLSTLVTMKQVNGPEFTTALQRVSRGAESNGSLAPGYTSHQGMRALEEVFAETMSREMGFDYSGMSFQEKAASEGIPPVRRLWLFPAGGIPALAAQYESWKLPFGVLLGTPIAVLGAVGALWIARYEARRVLPDRPGDGDRPGRQERDPDRRVLQGGYERGASLVDAPWPAPASAASYPHDRVRVHFSGVPPRDL